MAALAPVCDFGWKAPDFRLPGVDGKTWALSDVRGSHGTLIVFICNHCPYVKAIVSRLVRDAKDLQAAGIGVAAICSNDPDAYPEDSFDNMKRFAEAQGFTFPYLHDETQEVARAYGAKTTPDVFVVDRERRLRYRGAPDGDHSDPARNAEWLRAALEAVLDGRDVESPATQPVGCSIKWRP